MAMWFIVREDGEGLGKLKIFYKNLYTGMVYRLDNGLSTDIPDQMCVDWIFDHGEPQLGDWVQLSNGRLMRFFTDGATA